MKSKNKRGESGSPCFNPIDMSKNSEKFMVELERTHAFMFE